MKTQSGKLIAVIFLFGGASVIRSLMRSEINGFYLTLGCILLAISLVMFIKQMKNI
ncbi:MAG: hypothetical protein HKN08_06325 [Gammaproteobacteria bacterium]|nr:hypothetical protein [Gammaproteobacteria bacterium]